MTSSPPLRVGLLLGSTTLPRWLRRVVEEVAGSPDCLLSVVVRAPEARPPAEEAPLYRLYRSLDRRLFGRGPGAFDLVDVSDLIGGRSELQLTAGDGSESIDEADLARLREHELDVLLCLDSRPRGERAARAARFGTWAFRFGGSADHPEAVAARAVLGGLHVSTASLERLGGGDVYAATLKTDRLSTNRHLDHVGAVASSFAVRALGRLRREGTLPQSAEAGPLERTTVVPPGTVETASLVASFGGRLAAEGVRRAFQHDQWVMAYSTRGTWDGPRPDLSTMKVLAPPPDRFWADPFPARIGGRSYIFFEDYPYATHRGIISVVEVDDSGCAGPSRPALERDYHLSYPFVFAWDGELYMIPETSASGDVELYRCERAPDRWAYDRALIPGLKAADATLAEHDGRWWLFACVAAPGASNDIEELHLFHAPSPMGPWSPHPSNPVKSDVASARPAGGLYLRDGVWHRPAQDCSQGYGVAMVLNRIRRWDLSGFEEEEVGRIEPDWAPGASRTHTFNAEGSFFVADARISRFRRPGRGSNSG